MRWLVIVALVGGCGRVGYDAAAIDTIGLPDGGDGAAIDPALTDAATDGVAVMDDAMLPIDAAVDAAVDAAGPLLVNGNYSTAQVQYTCALGLVALDFNSFAFSDNSSTLTVTSSDVGAPPQPCAMVGSSVGDSGNINVTCTLPGGCDEIYTLTGSFTDADNWRGTFTADFVGSCVNCMMQSFPVSGTRQQP